MDFDAEPVIGPAFADVMTSLGRRFGKRLQLPPLARVMDKVRERQSMAAE